MKAVKVARDDEIVSDFGVEVADWEKSSKFEFFRKKFQLDLINFNLT